MSYQKGDQHIVIGGRRYTLRLTLGALCHLSARLNLGGPQQLSACLRNFSEARAQAVLDCVIHPAAPTPLVISADDWADILPRLCALFEVAFADG